MKQHWAIFIQNDSNKEKLIDQILNSSLPQELSYFKGLKGVLFSKISVDKYIDKEERHGAKIIAKDKEQPLQTMSSGEQKKALLKNLLKAKVDYIILDNPFDNLDSDAQQALKTTLTKRANQTAFIQLISRKSDLLPFISNFSSLDKNKLQFHKDLKSISASTYPVLFKGKIPLPLDTVTKTDDVLVHFKDVQVSFGKKKVLKYINWQIKQGEFWQLIGKNGSGKTTLLSMITGENSKGFGQELFFFGKKKGSGETIWDIKKHIGYFTPSMTNKFTGHHSIEAMIISGFNDSVGLYIKPTESQIRITKEWLELIDLWKDKDTQFHELSMGQKRLVMTIRAMIKHPKLLILDEPTAGLDDSSAKLLVALVNKIAKESNTATIFVSHRKEEGLKPQYVYKLQRTNEGSIGKVL